MDIVVDRHQGPPPSDNEIIARMREERLTPHSWGNAPGDTYGWHEHSYEKMLYCVRGRIVFHTDTGDVDLGPGDRLVLPPHTRPLPRGLAPSVDGGSLALPREQGSGRHRGTGEALDDLGLVAFKRCESHK